jgi:hypothetical protein
MTTIRPFRAPRLVFLAAAVVFLVPLAACYTLVQHPRVTALDYRRPADRSCTECHRAEAVRDYLRPERLPDPTHPWDALEEPWWLPPDSTGGDG